MYCRFNYDLIIIPGVDEKHFFRLSEVKNLQYEIFIPRLHLLLVCLLGLNKLSLISNWWPGQNLYIYLNLNLLFCFFSQPRPWYKGFFETSSNKRNINFCQTRKLYTVKISTYVEYMFRVTYVKHFLNIR